MEAGMLWISAAIQSITCFMLFMTILAQKVTIISYLGNRSVGLARLYGYHKMKSHAAVREQRVVPNSPLMSRELDILHN